MSKNFMRPSIGSSMSRSASRTRWPAATCRTARWCSTTSRLPTLRAAPAHWRNSVTIATAKASCRSCLGFFAPPRDARWRSRSSRAMSADPSTLESQVSKIKGRFALERVVLVGDRGMITEARLNETIKPAGLDWITALRAPAIRGLVEAGAIQLSLFDQCDLAEVTSPDYPDERLVVCRNPLLAEERTRKRQALLDQTEKKLLPIQARVRRAKRPLRGKDK